MNYSVFRERVLKYRPDLDLAALDAAYDFAAQWHEGRTLYSGQPAVSHPVAAADLLLSLNPDLLALQACLLHDVVEDTDCELSDVEQKFGSKLADLVDGLGKLSVVKWREGGPNDELWRKLFLALSKDLRLVLIKLADRLNSMQTLEFVPEEKRERIAKESLYVHAAVASRLGIYKMKSQLEDLCFKCLYPKEFEKLSKELASYKDRSESMMQQAASELERFLLREGVQTVRVKGRMKHLWSLHQKMQRKESESLKDVYDLFALRIVLPDSLDGEGKEQLSHLYSTLGLLHGEYLPLQDRFKDYVAVPKPNGYRSLHSTVLGLLADHPTEVQIRTELMDKEAELGVASHWTYKEKGSSSRRDQKRMRALAQALEDLAALLKKNPDLEGLALQWLERYQHMSPEDRSKIENSLLAHGFEEPHLEAIRVGRSMGPVSMNLVKGLSFREGEDLELYPDKIFVLTPAGDILELVKGATILDFAYAIHTEVGNKCVHGKVNGRIVPLDHELSNGDRVEIGTRRDSFPKKEWLSVVKSGQAKSKIKNWFNRQNRDSNVRKGRELLNRELKLAAKELLDDKMLLLKNYGGKARTLQEREEILEGIGLGSMSVSQAMKTLFGTETTRAQRPKITSVEELSREVLVTGEQNLPVVLSACCKPRPPMPIIGYVTRGKSIRVHRQSCQELNGLEGQRFVSAHWAS